RRLRRIPCARGADARAVWRGLPPGAASLSGDEDLLIADHTRCELHDGLRRMESDLSLQLVYAVAVHQEQASIDDGPPLRLRNPLVGRADSDREALSLGGRPEVEDLPADVVTAVEVVHSDV